MDSTSLIAQGKKPVGRISQAVERLGQSQRAKKLSRPPKDLVSLASGDPSFDTPDHIREAGIAAIRAGHTHYSPPMGETELRVAVAADLSTLGGGTFKTEDVLISNGAASGIYAGMLAYLDPGDEVLLHDPTYSLYSDVALSIGAVPVFVPWTADLRLDIVAMERAVTARTRMFVLNNPVNPTGIVLTEAEMRAVVDFVRRHDLLLLSDEAYDHLVYDNRPMISAARFEEIADRTIVINTCSKTFAMTGWRVGYVAARGGLLRAAAVIHRTTLGNVNTMAQLAAVTAFTQRTNWPGRMLDEYTRRRDLMCGMVNAMPGLHCAKPEGAFYVFVRVNVPLSSEQLTEHCMRHGVAVRSGTEFGSRGEGFIRLTFAGEPSSFRPGLERLDKAMRAL
ncbi:MAG: aminotransferase class I/II-fold pyridoxal phosphate-dependent enzyme [Proteobacteria bacterium]|nr:aminotransferase class I/II-fold pyridoxal phosphate-dependent enzyme [Pseudomonadota bacterium]